MKVVRRVKATALPPTERHFRAVEMLGRPRRFSVSSNLEKDFYSRQHRHEERKSSIDSSLALASAFTFLIAFRPENRLESYVDFFHSILDPFVETVSRSFSSSRIDFPSVLFLQRSRRRKPRFARPLIREKGSLTREQREEAVLGNEYHVSIEHAGSCFFRNTADCRTI